MNHPLFNSLGLRFTRWAEPDSDGSVLFEAVDAQGRVIVAGSLDLILTEALTDQPNLALMPLARASYSALTFAQAA